MGGQVGSGREEREEERKERAGASERERESEKRRERGEGRNSRRDFRIRRSYTFVRSCDIYPLVEMIANF